MLKKIYKKIKKNNTIVIARHIGVDPDALGAQFGLKASIMATFPEKKVYAVGGKSSKYNYFPRMDKFDEPSENVLLIIVDTPDKKRADGVVADDFNEIIKIDHHPFVETFGELEYIDTESSSASELIFNLIKSTPLVMNEDVAEYLFTGIISDSNRFLFNTSYNTFEIAAGLLKKYNFDLPIIYKNIYMRPLSEIRFQGYIAQNLMVTKNGLAYIKITNDVMNEFGVDCSSAGNMVNNFNNIEEIYVWVTVSEDSKNSLFKFNIRSRGPVVNTIAEQYNGGGHQFASGARVYNEKDVDKLIKDLDTACKEYLKEVGD